MTVDVVREDRPGRVEPRRSGGLRTDIQALRALAVSLVLVYHLFPTRLSGGFAGVDVFFVISGFLITTHLLAHPPVNLRDLLGFWGRRIRRLLPASLLVLTVTLVASRLVAPETQWEGTARQVSAAARYFVNWMLASDSVDYLAAENAPSPVQHFWSLSVEEQFYLGWPVLVLVLALGAKLLRDRWVFALGIATVLGVSLAWSIHLTATDPARAYFVTTTRIWELAAGGLVAAIACGRAGGGSRRTRSSSSSWALSDRARDLIALVGLGMVLWTGFTYTTSTPFPGWQAAVPVVGTALVIMAGIRDTPRSLGGLLALRPVQWLGGVSYSVYLWHWPLVVLVPAATEHPLTRTDKAFILVATLVLSGLTKVFVEDAFRTAGWSRRLGSTYALGAIGMAIVIGLAAWQTHEVQDRAAQAQHQVDDALDSHDPCLGAGALSPGRDCPEATGAPIPAPALAAKDKSMAYSAVSGSKDCWSYLPSFPQVHCEFGEPDGETTVAIVGNSHAGQWLPAVQELAERQDLRITTYLASQCALSDVDQVFKTSAHTQACSNWVDKTVDQVIADRPDVVVLSNRSSVAVVGRTEEESAGPYAAGYTSVLQEWDDAGLTVLALHDTPASGDAGAQNAPDCVAENPDDYDVCAGPRADWEPDDPVEEAVQTVDSPHIMMADLNDHICTEETCSGVVGGVIVYFDGSHMTATFARTLAPFLAPELKRAIKVSR